MAKRDLMSNNVDLQYDYDTTKPNVNELST